MLPSFVIAPADLRHGFLPGRMIHHRDAGKPGAALRADIRLLGPLINAVGAEGMAAAVDGAPGIVVGANLCVAYTTKNRLAHVQPLNGKLRLERQKGRKEMRRGLVPVLRQISTLTQFGWVRICRATPFIEQTRSLPAAPPEQ